MKRLKLILVLVIWIILGFLLYDIGENYFVNINKLEWWQNVNMGIKWTLKQTLTDVVDSISGIYSDDEYISTEKYRVFEKVDNILKKEYWDPSMLSGSKMLENAIKWYVNAVGDPFTVYLSPSDNKTFNKELKGSNEFEWIWAYVTKKDNGVMIERLIKWGPAYNSELKPLDIILKADDVSLVDLPLWEAVSYIKGPAGTNVTLTVLRWEKIFEVKVVREKVEIKSVTGDIYTLTWDINIWYISISIFWEDTENSLEWVIQDFKKNNLKWIIIDLRWNGGWFLPVAVDVASHWVPKEKIISIARYRTRANEKLLSKGFGDFEDLPVVILVDWLTASASEIISAAIKYRDNALLVWTKTFGKWSIQTMEEFDDGSSLKYTIWRWDTPIWDNINKVGIEPDVKIEFDADKYKEGFDNQLDMAKKTILDIVK